MNTSPRELKRVQANGAARCLQLAWRAHLVRATLWRRNKIRQYQRECLGQTVMAALWRGFRTKHYGPHAKALRSRRVQLGLPEEPPPFGSNRMIKRDRSVLLRWADKKAALERRTKLPSHETLLQQHARKRAWAQQRSDDIPAACVHWSTRALLKTVASYDEMRPKVCQSPERQQPKRKSDKDVGDFSLQWLTGVGAWGWVQRRVVLLLQTIYRSHLARRLLAHVTRQKQGVARTRLRSSAQLRSSDINRSSVEKTKILNAYGGRKSVLYALMHSEDPRPSTGSPSQAHRQNRNERLKQLVAFAGNLWVDRCLARWLWYYAWRLEHKQQTKAAKLAYAKMGLAKMFRLYRAAAQRQRSLKAKLAIATGGAGKKLLSLAFRSWLLASREKKRVSFAVKTLVRKIWREVLLSVTRAWKEAAADQAYERKKSNRVETLQEQAKRRMDEMTLHTVFYDWVDSFMQRMEELEEAAGKIFGNSRRIVLRNALAAMRGYANEKMNAKANIAKATKCLYRSVLVKSLRSWRLDAQETGGQKRRVEEKRKKAMYKFANRCVSMSFQRWACGTHRRREVVALAAAAHKTLCLAIKKGAFARLRDNVLERAQERMQAVAGAIAWSVATPGKISMWPTLLRQAQHQAAAALPVHNLTQDAAGSLAAFGRDNFNNALLQGLTLGALRATADSSSPPLHQHRRRHQELSPLAHSKTGRSARHMELRPDSGDEEDGAQEDVTRDDWRGDCNVRSVAGSMLPLPIGSNILLPHTASLVHKTKPTHAAPATALPPARSSGQYLSSLSTKTRKMLQAAAAGTGRSIGVPHQQQTVLLSSLPKRNRLEHQRPRQYSSLSSQQLLQSEDLFAFVSAHVKSSAQSKSRQASRGVDVTDFAFDSTLSQRPYW